MRKRSIAMLICVVANLLSLYQLWNMDRGTRSWDAMTGVIGICFGLALGLIFADPTQPKET